MTDVSNAAKITLVLIVNTNVSKIKIVAASGTLYTAAKPAPEAQASSRRASSSRRPKRRIHTEANAALISLGATSRPIGEPKPTVTICNSEWHTVVKNGSPLNGFSSEALIVNNGAPRRLIRNQPTPANTPHSDKAATRRQAGACSTPTRKGTYSWPLNA